MARRPHQFWSARNARNSVHIDHRGLLYYIQSNQHEFSIYKHQATDSLIVIVRVLHLTSEMVWF